MRSPLGVGGLVTQGGLGTPLGWARGGGRQGGPDFTKPGPSLGARPRVTNLLAPRWNRIM